MVHGQKNICKYALVEGKAVSDDLGTVGPLQEKMREGGRSQEWQRAERVWLEPSRSLRQVWVGKTREREGPENPTTTSTCSGLGSEGC